MPDLNRREASTHGMQHPHPSIRPIPLNRSERMYLAMEGVVGAVSQVYALRFHEAHAEDELRGAIRHILRIYPRMRSVIRPTAFTHGLQVLPDDAQMDTLFAKAFQVLRGVPMDTASLETSMATFAGEPFDLEHELPMRARLLVDGQVSVLIFIVHHVVCDGRGMVRMMDSIMACLNGAQHPEISVDKPGMLPAVLPESWTARVRSFIRSYRLHHAEIKTTKRLQTIEIGQPCPVFGRPGVYIHAVPFDGDLIRKCATNRGCSMTELQLALLVKCFARDAKQDGQNTISIRISVDLRPYFAEDQRPSYGNYVASFMLQVKRWNNIGAILADVRAQLRDNLKRFERKEMSYPLVMAELSSSIGRNLLGRTLLAMKRRGRLPKATFHFSKIGVIDMLNGHGARAQLDAVHGFVSTMVPFITSWSLGGQQSFTCVFPSHEVDKYVIRRIFSDFNAALGGLLEEDQPGARL